MRFHGRGEFVMGWALLLLVWVVSSLTKTILGLSYPFKFMSVGGSEGEESAEGTPEGQPSSLL